MEHRLAIRNREGYMDPTPFFAVMNIEREERRSKIMNDNDIRRGDIFYIYRSCEQTGSEQASGRPAIVVSNDLCNRRSNVIEVVYLTTQPKTDMPTHVRISSTARVSTALCEQISSVDKTRLGDFYGTCNDEELREVDAAILISLGIATLPDQPKEVKEEIRKGEDSALIKAETQRDTYKMMYEGLVQQLVGKL